MSLLFFYICSLLWHKQRTANFICLLMGPRSMFLANSESTYKIKKSFDKIYITYKIYVWVCAQVSLTIYVYECVIVQVLFFITLLVYFTDPNQINVSMLLPRKEGHLFCLYIHLLNLVSIYKCLFERLQYKYQSSSQCQSLQD